MVALQEQFLKAGLVDKNKVKLANQDKSKQKKVERRTGTQSRAEFHPHRRTTHQGACVARPQAVQYANQET
jgi:hypothetical protein